MLNALTRRFADRGYELDRRRRIDCLRTRDWKLIVYPGTGDDCLELYRLDTDPEERNDLARARPEVARNMLDALRRWRADSDVAFANPQISDELRGKLEALGYVE